MGGTVRRKALAGGELPKLLRPGEAGRTVSAPGILHRLEAGRLHRAGRRNDDDRDQAIFGNGRSAPAAPQRFERDGSRESLQCDVPFHGEGR